MHRREFLQTTSAGLLTLPGFSLNLPGERFQVAPMLGQFAQHGGYTVSGEIRFLADQGFRTLSDPFFLLRKPVPLRQEIVSAMQRENLQLGAVHCSSLVGPVNWNHLANSPTLLRKSLRETIEQVAEFSCRQIMITPHVPDARSFPMAEFFLLADRLREAAENCGKHGFTLLIKTLPGPASKTVLPLRGVLKLVRQVDHPQCRLALDSADAWEFHRADFLSLMHSPELGSLVGEVQFMDSPGRCEPGSGEIDFSTLLSNLHRAGFQGQITLNHGHSHPGREGEKHSLQVYRQLGLL